MPIDRRLAPNYNAAWFADRGKLTMPLYTYRCENCGVQFEKSQGFNDKPLTRCPECRKGKVRRIVQPAAIVFKGSGWYATDSRSASQRHVSTSSSKSSSESGSGDKPAAAAAPKTETKPAKTETKAD
jgi:putative FmdB family regulatory protein